MAWAISGKGRVVHHVLHLDAVTGRAVYTCGASGQRSTVLTAGERPERVRCHECCRMTGVTWYEMGAPE